MIQLFSTCVEQSVYKVSVIDMQEPGNFAYKIILEKANKEVYVEFAHDEDLATIRAWDIKFNAKRYDPTSRVKRHWAYGVGTKK